MVASDILIEPAAKNTVATICAAALALEAEDPGALMLVASSDYVIPDGRTFGLAVQAATPAAKASQLVTFGIRPECAETGYGWLQLTQAPDAEFGPRHQPL